MKLKELIPNKDRWTKGHYALNNKGQPVTPSFFADTPNISCYCLNGAIFASCEDSEDRNILTNSGFCAKASTMAQIITKLYPHFAKRELADIKEYEATKKDEDRWLITAFNDKSEYSDIEKVIEEFDHVY